MKEIEENVLPPGWIPGGYGRPGAERLSPSCPTPPPPFILADRLTVLSMSWKPDKQTRCNEVASRLGDKGRCLSGTLCKAAGTEYSAGSTVHAGGEAPLRARWGIW